MSDSEQSQPDSEQRNSLSAVEIVALAAVLLAIAIPLLMVLAAL